MVHDGDPAVVGLDHARAVHRQLSQQQQAAGLAELPAPEGGQPAEHGALERQRHGLRGDAGMGPGRAVQGGRGRRLVLLPQRDRLLVSRGRQPEPQHPDLLAWPADLPLVGGAGEARGPE